jgi:hypothetical protein
MAFKKGDKKIPGSGKKKGQQHKTTWELKEMIRQALDESGGINYLKRQAAVNPNAFMTLVGKIIPSEIRNQVTGKDGGPIETRTLPASDKWLESVVGGGTDEASKILN